VLDGPIPGTRDFRDSRRYKHGRAIVRRSKFFFSIMRQEDRRDRAGGKAAA